MSSGKTQIVLVTGSAGYLGSGLCKRLRELDPALVVIGVDKLSSEFTTHVGSIVDRAFLDETLSSALASNPNSVLEAIFHTAALHRPHIGPYNNSQFVDVNVHGTLNLLDLAVANKCEVFINTSTTSTFGNAMKSPEGAVWVTEDLVPSPKNIYGVTKIAAENLCKLYHDLHKLNVLTLRTSRFFPEDDYDKDPTLSYLNARVNEVFYRRIDHRDVIEAHVAAWKKARELHFGLYVISGRTPFHPEDTTQLGINAPESLFSRVPGLREAYEKHGFRMSQKVDRIYDAGKAEKELGFQQKFDYEYHLRTDFADFDRRSHEKPYL